MSKFIENNIRIITFVVTFALLYFMNDVITVNSIDAILTSFLGILSVFTCLLIGIAAKLLSDQDKRFIKIAKTSGAYQMLLRSTYVAIVYCVISIPFAIVAELLACGVLKLVILSVCFGSFSSALLVGYLFIKLMECNSSDL